MLTKFIQLLKVLTLSLFWLVFPPVFFLLSKLWYPVRKSMRRLLFFLSPLVVITIFSSLVYISVLTSDALRGSKWTIEKKTEIDFPSYSRNNFKFLSSLLQENSLNSIFGDHSMSYTAQLKPSQCDEFFKEIEQLINDSVYNNPKEKGVSTRFWQIDQYGNYSFSYLREQPEEYLNITINPKTYEMRVGFGTW
jgi:hypothetical protein